MAEERPARRRIDQIGALLRGDDEHRNPFVKRRDHTGKQVGRAGTGIGEHRRNLAGRHAPPSRHAHRGGPVAHRDPAHAERIEAGEDRVDLGARDPEHDLDALTGQQASEELTAGDRRGGRVRSSAEPSSDLLGASRERRRHPPAYDAMRRISKTAATIAGILLIGAIGYLASTRSSALNAFRPITPHFAGSCVKDPGRDRRRRRRASTMKPNVAYVSATDRHAASTPARPRAPPLDGIYRLPLGAVSGPAPTRRSISPCAGSTTSTRTASISATSRGRRPATLRRQSQPSSGHSVEVLRVEHDHLVHLETVRDALDHLSQRRRGSGARAAST